MLKLQLKIPLSAKIQLGALIGPILLVGALSLNAPVLFLILLLNLVAVWKWGLKPLLIGLPLLGLYGVDLTTCSFALSLVISALCLEEGKELLAKEDKYTGELLSKVYHLETSLAQLSEQELQNKEREEACIRVLEEQIQQGERELEAYRSLFATQQAEIEKLRTFHEKLLEENLALGLKTAETQLSFENEDELTRLKQQSEERGEALFQARKEFFQLETEYHLLQKDILEQKCTFSEEEQALLQALDAKEQECLRLEEEVKILEDMITPLSEQKKPKRSKKVKAQELEFSFVD